MDAEFSDDGSDSIMSSPSLGVVSDDYRRLAFSISLAACGSTFRSLDACRERWTTNASTSRTMAMISSRRFRSMHLLSLIGVHDGVIG